MCLFFLFLIFVFHIFSGTYFAKKLYKKVKARCVDTGIRPHPFLRFLAGITDDVFIDNNGDRDTSYAIMDMNQDTGEFEVRLLVM